MPGPVTCAMLISAALAAIGSPRIAPPPDAPTATPPAPVATPAAQPFPHIRVDRENKLIELDGIVPIDAHRKATTKVYLEVIACTPDTKEHEALVLTKAKASDVHAALLLLGLEPGTPGAWKLDGQKLNLTEPTGPKLAVTIAYTNAEGAEVEAPASDWVTVESSTRTLTQAAGDAGGFVFAGSKFSKTADGERYKADDDGTLIGLTTFGGETIAWLQVFSPDAATQEPDWIANKELVPKYDTAVKVRIRPIAR